jgi:hypothetical protein
LYILLLIKLITVSFFFQDRKKIPETRKPKRTGQAEREYPVRDLAASIMPDSVPITMTRLLNFNSASLDGRPGGSARSLWWLKPFFFPLLLL